MNRAGARVNMQLLDQDEGAPTRRLRQTGDCLSKSFNAHSKREVMTPGSDMSVAKNILPGQFSPRLFVFDGWQNCLGLEWKNLDTNSTMPKKLKGDPLGFFNIHSVAELQKIEAGSFGIFWKKVSMRKKLKGIL